MTGPRKPDQALINTQQSQGHESSLWFCNYDTHFIQNSLNNVSTNSFPIFFLCHIGIGYGVQVSTAFISALCRYGHSSFALPQERGESRYIWCYVQQHTQSLRVHSYQARIDVAHHCIRLSNSFLYRHRCNNGSFSTFAMIRVQCPFSLLDEQRQTNRPTHLISRACVCAHRMDGLRKSLVSSQDDTTELKDKSLGQNFPQLHDVSTACSPFLLVRLFSILYPVCDDAEGDSALWALGKKCLSVACVQEGVFEEKQDWPGGWAGLCM